MMTASASEQGLPEEQLAAKKAKVDWRFIIQKTLIAIACIFVGLPLLLGFTILIAFSPPVAEHWLLFHPRKLATDSLLDKALLGANPEHVHFNDSFGNKLHGVFYKKPDTTKIILVSHGNGGCMEQRECLAGFLLRSNASVFMYDYAGYGSSTGIPSCSVAMDDATCAYNYVTKTLSYPPAQVVLFGESLGTAVTARLSGKVKSAGIVLECPVYSVKRIGKKLLPILDFYPDWMWSEEALDTSGVLSKAHVPLLMVAGTEDHTTWCDLSDDLYKVAAMPKQYIRVEGGGHCDGVLMSAPEYQDGIVTFVNGLK